MRVAPAFFITLGLSLLAVTIAPAQISAEEQRKRDLFLKARESIEPLPAATPARPPVRPQPRPRPVEKSVEQPLQPIKLPPPRSTPPPKPRPKPRPEPRATPKAKVTPPPRATPVPPAAGRADDFVLPPAQDSSSDVIKLPPPRSAPTPRSGREPVEKVPAAPIVVEKSGQEDEQGMAPVPERERRGWFGWGGGPRHRYLTRNVRAAIDRAPVKRGRWQYVIVHNSGTRQGNARIFANYHKNVRKMKNGLAYHFVIGNGTSSGDGEIEIGPRWTAQINGGHVASDYLNNIGIGICFVGDYNRHLPTKAQLAALEELIKYLRKRAGRSKGRVLIVKAHREINPKPTDCPGNRFPYSWMRRTF